jgi:hypothetical protein
MAKSDSLVLKEEFKKLPYLIEVPEDGRAVPTYPYFDHSSKKWKIWVDQDGSLFEMNALDLDGAYISEAPAFPEVDYHLPFEEIVLKHFCTPEIFKIMVQVSEDLINALSYIEKYFIFLYQHNHPVNKDMVKRLDIILRVELKGMFGLHRSFYDLLQLFVEEIYFKYSKTKKDFPDSFAKMIQKEPIILENEFNIPKPIINFYVNKKPIFLLCRKIRDNIYHHGHSFGMIYSFDDGFAIEVEEKNLNELDKIVGLWSPERLKKNRLGSVLNILVFIVDDMFETMSALAESIMDSFDNLPNPIFTEHVYLRTQFARHLHRLKEYREKQWFKPEEIFQ